MRKNFGTELTDVIGNFPYRMALAGGWIDQPFVSGLNPDPPGAMVVAALEPAVRFMDRSGMATGTRKVAVRLWKGQLPDGEPADLVRELYHQENKDQADPSGSQDMIGLLYPGINRLDYDSSYEKGIFPVHIESVCDPQIAAWLEKVVHMIPVAPRPEGYHPLEIRNLDPEWIARLGQSGRDCFASICAMDPDGLGASLNACMNCWQILLPNTIGHRTITIDLKALLRHYQSRYPGAMYSGCGGGYLYVISEEPVPGSFRVKIRL